MTIRRTAKVKEVQDDYAVYHTTESGFSLKITPLPPYYLDIIEDVYPLLDYPAREIQLHAGDIVSDPYIPPEEAPGSDHEDYYLYVQWHEVDRRNEEIKDKRTRSRRDLLISICVKILEGPVDMDEEEWANDLEAPFADTDFKVPKDRGQRKLLFLKYVVINSVDEAQFVIGSAMYKEVSMEGVGRALQGFQSNVGRSIDRESAANEQGENPG